MGGVATYYLKSEKLPTPAAEMIQPRYNSEYKFLITQQWQPMYKIRPSVSKAKQASLVQPRYKWRVFRNHQNKLKNHQNKLKKSTTCPHQNKLKNHQNHQKKLKNHQNKLKNHQNLRLVFQNDYGKTVRMKHCTSDDKEFYEYVANYAHLLNKFLEVYNLAADQCEDDSDQAAFLGWSKNVKQELERHNSIVEQKLGLDPTRETTLHTATAKYKEFLLATASGDIQGHEIPIHQSKIPAYTLGAMTKAVRELVTLDDTSHPRSKWIKEYCYENFKTSYLHAEVLLDKLCNSLAQEEIEVVERLYRHAMRLKMDFFYSRQSEQTLIIPVYTKLDPKERLILFADFDFTCTDLGSLGVLENIAIMTAQKADQLLQGQDRDKPSHITSTDLKNTWELLSQQSTFEYDNCIKKIMLGEKALNFNYHGLHSALVELSSSEGQAVSRIFGSGVLKGISLEDIKQAGKCMILKNGCMNFFKKVNKLDASVNIMSCWSEELTRSALSGGLDTLEVDGNAFSYADGIFTGEFTRQAHQSVTDKLKYFEDMVQENEDEHGLDALSVFIGTSVGDLLCLLEADIGIVIGSNRRLIEVGKHFGVRFVPLYAGVVDKQKKHSNSGNSIVWMGGLSGILYTVSSWTEIHAFILGRDLKDEEL
ncbi:hypothetical protein MKW98_011289 [Papaver atlanticum]|uniref:Thiaminase-2/PQQC domain-containing protein n=1 Tax=Papaver atlanticum TaxID=357466 RepID=A0AAD4SVN2_9MAGN|nr:hypothetical protein MKW98_011289 [Papaver atlanticum]